MDKQRDRLVALLQEADQKVQEYILENDHMDWIPKPKELEEVRADYLLANGVIVPPCKVGDTVWDTEGNDWKVFAITIWQDCIGLKTANNRDIRKTFTIGKHSIGKTVFLSKQETENALGGVQG